MPGWRMCGANGRLWACVVAAVVLFWLATAGIELSNECAMTYMRGPRLRPIRLLKPDRSSYKYSLMRYVQTGVAGDYRKPHGSPVLFLPGHLGSAMQARSFGSHAVQLQNSASFLQDHRPLDVYTVDFNEEWSGISGHHLADQAEFVNSAVQTILALYSVDHRPAAAAGSAARAPWKRPTHVVVVAHSMAGFAARAALTLSNYRSNTIRTIITLSTPHQQPPFRLESSMGALYDEVNAVWSEAAGYTDSEAAYVDRKRHAKRAAETAAIEEAAAGVATASGKAERARAAPDGEGSPTPDEAPAHKVTPVPTATRPKYRHAKALLASVASTTVVSVAGGFQDQLIYAGLTRLDGLVDLRRVGLQFLATDLPNGVSADHLALLWCHQVTHTVVAAVAAITDPASGWIPADRHASVINATLYPPNLRLAPPVLTLDDDSVFSREYASRSRPLVTRLGFVVHWFLVQDGAGALAFWLAIFCCILAQFLATKSAGPSRPELALAVWPGCHNPLLREEPAVSSLLHRAAKVAAMSCIAFCLYAQYIAPVVAAQWLLDAVALPAQWASSLGLARAAAQYLVAAAAATLALHFMDNAAWLAARMLGGARRLCPRLLAKAILRVRAVGTRHAAKMMTAFALVLAAAAHSMDRQGNEGFEFAWKLRPPSLALELAIVHVSMLTVTGVGFLRLFFGVAGSPRTRAVEYKRLVLWGYLCFIPVAFFQAIASVEVVTRAPAANLRHYNWRALLHVLTLCPVAAHLFVASAFPIVPTTFSPDSNAGAEALAVDDGNDSEDDERGSTGPRKPDYAARLAKRRAAQAKRRRRAGCQFGPHEFGAAWSTFEDDPSSPAVVRHEFANGEVVFEGVLFSVADCNCAGEGLEPAEWCSFCRCKICGVRTWESYDSGGRRTPRSWDPSDSDLMTRLALHLTAMLAVIFATGAVHRVHVFAALVAAQALYAHMQRSHEMQLWYSSN